MHENSLTRHDIEHMLRKIEEQLQRTEEQLTILETDKQILLTTRDNLRQWLSRHNVNEDKIAVSSQEAAKDTRQRVRGHTSLKREQHSGHPSLRGTILEIMKQSGGRELSTEEVWKLAQERGAVTASRRPVSVVLLNLRGLTDKYPIKKTGTNTWRWVSQSSPSE